MVRSQRLVGFSLFYILYIYSSVKKTYRNHWCFVDNLEIDTWRTPFLSPTFSICHTFLYGLYSTYSRILVVLYFVHLFSFQLKTWNRTLNSNHVLKQKQNLNLKLIHSPIIAKLLSMLFFHSRVPCIHYVIHFLVNQLSLHTCRSKIFFYFTFFRLII